MRVLSQLTVIVAAVAVSCATRSVGSRPSAEREPVFDPKHEDTALGHGEGYESAQGPPLGYVPAGPDGGEEDARVAVLAAGPDARVAACDPDAGAQPQVRGFSWKLYTLKEELRARVSAGAASRQEKRTLRGLCRILHDACCM